MWSDTFEGPPGAPPNASLWTAADGPGNVHVGQLQYYSPSAVALDGAGNLVITTTNASTHPGFAFTSGWVDTARKQAGARPGTAAVRWEVAAQLPEGQGFWPAHWLMPEAAICWPKGGEIDIMERLNSQPRVHAAFHANLTGCGCCQPGVGAFSPTLPADPSRAVHRYGVVWSPTPANGGDDTLRFLFDDDEYFVASDVASQLPADDSLFHLIINSALGGEWPGSPDSTTRFPQFHVIASVSYSVLDGP